MQTEDRGDLGDALAVLGPTLEFLKQYAPFDSMTTPHVQFLAKHLRLGFYSKGKSVVDAGTATAQTLFIVKQGLVRADAGADAGTERRPGDCFPVDALLARRPVAVTQRAVQDTFCFELGWENFEKLFAQSQVFRNFCLKAQSRNEERAR
jgi:CBS domain-containing protein